jgi:hypothetical protein
MGELASTMLAFTDESLARVFISATAIAPQTRGRWLQDLARELENKGRPLFSGGPKPSVQRLRDFRQRQRLGQSIYRLTLDAVNLEELLIAARTLRPEDRDTHSKVELALTKFLELLIADHNAALG